MATIRKRGSKFHAQIRKHGHRTITKTFTRKADAETWSKQIESEIERGVFVDATPAQQTTLSEALDRYERDILPTKKGADIDLFRIKRLHVALGSLTLSQIQPHIVAKFRDQRLQQVKPATVKKELGMLSRTLTAAQKEFGIHLPHGNPVTQIRQPQEPRGRERRPTAEELEALCSDSTVGKLATFAVETGMRRGEIVSMRWEHINWKSQTLSIPETKTDTPRTIPLSKKAIQTLSQLPRRIDGLVWGIRPDSITQSFERACKRYSITDLRFHDLRHEATSMFFEKGLNSMEVSSITGHQDLRMLKRYTHIKPESLVNRL